MIFWQSIWCVSCKDRAGIQTHISCIMAYTDIDIESGEEEEEEGNKTQKEQEEELQRVKKKQVMY